MNLLDERFAADTPSLGCDERGDANDVESLTIASSIQILGHPFVPGATPIAAPIPSCGEDPTAGALGGR